MTKKKRHFAGAPPQKEGQLGQDTGTNVDLQFLKHVIERRYQDAVSVIDQVKNINIADPKTGRTALHYAAARSAEGLLVRLQARNDLDYLVRDSEGKFPSDIAWVVGRNEDLGAELMEKEQQQSQRTGQKVWPDQFEP
ncbi:MAG: hypothetical protein DBP01_05180 [gamma proteobacterium symbiont of Ctena orbiculata]|nr:MAG: hypothetical protein DBP01_05180 [gamma proteobacterium symbiont of Ctena orbiculata]